MNTIATATTIKEAKEKMNHAIALMGQGFEMRLSGNGIVDTKDGELLFPSYGGLKINTIGRKYLEVHCDGELITVDPGTEFQINFKIF